MIGGQLEHVAQQLARVLLAIGRLDLLQAVLADELADRLVHAPLPGQGVVEVVGQAGIDRQRSGIARQQVVQGGGDPRRLALA